MVLRRYEETRVENIRRHLEEIHTIGVRFLFSFNGYLHSGSSPSPSPALKLHSRTPPVEEGGKGVENGVENGVAVVGEGVDERVEVHMLSLLSLRLSLAANTFFWVNVAPAGTPPCRVGAKVGAVFMLLGSLRRRVLP